MARYNQFIPLYIGDYLRDTAHLTPQRHGIYLLLIFHYWTNESLPKTESELQIITRCFSASAKKDLKYIMSEFFDDDMKHSRIEKSLAESRNKYETACRKQAASVAARMHKTSEKGLPSKLPSKLPSGLPTSCKPYSSSSSSSPIVDIGVLKGDQEQVRIEF